MGGNIFFTTFAPLQIVNNVKQKILIKKMTSLTIAIIVVFVVGYLFIALESVTKVNKAAIALLMFVGCWTLFMCSPES